MPASLGSYAAFVSFLLTLGPKLQALWPKFQAVVTSATALFEELKKLLPPSAAPPATDGVLALTVAEIDGEPISAELLAAESQVAALVAGENALFDVATIRLLWQIIKAVPSLYAVFQKLAEGA